MTGWIALPYGWDTTSPPKAPSRSASSVRVPDSAAASASLTSMPLSTIPGTVGWAYPPNKGCGVWMEELSAIAISNSIGTWCVTHSCAVPTPPRYLPAPPESFQWEENGMRSGNSFSIDSTSGARPKAHHGNPYASMPSLTARAPWPSVLIGYAIMSAKFAPHWLTPARTTALPPLPWLDATWPHSSDPNRAREMQFATALIAPVAAMTEQDVAARASGDSMVFGGKMKSIGWNVAELTGRSWKTYS